MLGADLRAARERRGLSLRDLAALSGLSVASISSIERGVRYPTLSTLECLAEVLHVRIVIGPAETTLEQE